MRLTIDLDHGTVTSEPAPAAAPAPALAPDQPERALDGGEPSAALLAMVAAADGASSSPDRAAIDAIDAIDAGAAPA
jgi:hypothetical protein